MLNPKIHLGTHQWIKVLSVYVYLYKQGSGEIFPAHHLPYSVVCCLVIVVYFLKFIKYIREEYLSSKTERGFINVNSVGTEIDTSGQESIYFQSIFMTSNDIMVDTSYLN